MPDFDVQVTIPLPTVAIIRVKADNATEAKIVAVQQAKAEDKRLHREMFKAGEAIELQRRGN